MRLFAAGISIINPNDEARISTALSIGKYTLPAVVVLLLLFLIYSISRQYRFSMKFQLLNLLMVVHFSAVLILADQFTHLRLL